MKTQNAGCKYATILLLLMLGQCRAAANGDKKTTVSKKLKDLWMNRKDERSNFYEFMATEIIPHEDQILRDTDGSIPSEFLENTPISGADFPCKLFHNHSNPKSVHRLKPSDIDYVAALGDSITAAFGAKSKNLLDLLAEFRGVSWSIGGDHSLKDVVTVPNIIKEYYSDVKGFSVGITPLKIRIPWKSHLNYAVSGRIYLFLKKTRNRGLQPPLWETSSLPVGGNFGFLLKRIWQNDIQKYLCLVVLTRRPESAACSPTVGRFLAPTF